MTGAGEVCIPNIGSAGIARRRRTGWFWTAVGVATSLVFLARGVPPAWHLALLIVYGRGLIGILQARKKT
ncbi:MAG: hypothetical protein HYX65_07935 [Gemmatimonadetes bacterium]|nr:hypothetical protein [Gemmatimonadota bacterium]